MGLLKFGVIVLKYKIIALFIDLLLFKLIVNRGQGKR